MSRSREAFDTSVAAWSDYGRSPAGLLRHAEVLQHLRGHLQGDGLRVLDLGAGTGEMAADLARDGHEVTLVDFSSGMLEEAIRRCEGFDVTFLCVDASLIETLFEPGYFDVVLCHSLLEFVSDAQGVVRRVVDVLKVGGVLSLLVGNRYHLALREAIVQRDFERARLSLAQEIPAIDLFGLPRQTFYPEAVRQMLEARGLRIAAEYGVRVFFDLVQGLTDDVDSLLALELAASELMPYRHVSRFIHLIGKKQ